MIQKIKCFFGFHRCRDTQVRRTFEDYKYLVYIVYCDECCKPLMVFEQEIK